MTRVAQFPERTPDPLYKQILYTSQQVDERIEEMAVDIRQRYRGERPLFVGILRGAAPFTSKLMFAIAKQDPNFQPDLDWMTISTYGQDRNSKNPQLVMGLSPDTKAAGRLAVEIDDMLDEGKTSDFGADYLFGESVDEVELIVMTKKLKPRTNKLEPVFCGFELPPEWATGMGLDDRRICPEGNRWMGEIAIANS